MKRRNLPPNIFECNGWLYVRFEHRGESQRVALRIHKDAPKAISKAKAERDRILGDRGAYLEARSQPEALRLAEFAERYLLLKPEPADLSERRRIVGLFLEAFPKRNLDQISRLDIEALRDAWTENLGNRTVNLRLQVISALFNRALLESADPNLPTLLTVNPCKGVKRLEEKGRDRILELEEEEERLLKYCPRWLYPIVIAALSTGMRQGELLALKRAQVNWGEGEYGFIHLKPEDTKGGKLARSKGRRILKPRDIPMTGRCRVALESMTPNLRHTRFFSGSVGAPVSKNTLTDNFRKACALAGIEGLTFHDLRHTAATRYAEAGADAFELCDLFGWADIRMAQRYVKTGGKRLERMMRRIAVPREEREAK